MIAWLSENWLTLVQGASYVVAGASVAVKGLAPLTKTKKDDKLAAWLDKPLSWLNKIALNPKK